MSRPAIVFIGFMGAGKSTALAVARAAGLETTEIDELMEEALGKPIREAFEEDGEEAFRAREAEVVGELLERPNGGAIALGGGSILSERVRKALANHVVVWLQISAEEAWRRIANTGRPLATSKEDVERLMAERLPLYEQLADAVVPMADRDIISRVLPWIQILRTLEPGVRLLWASSESGEYPVFVGPGLLYSSWWPLEGRRYCISDTDVTPLYAGCLEPLAARIVIESGEWSKQLEVAEEVLLDLLHKGMARDDHIIALGGGVVGDLAGFCAHVYQRGVPVVHAPTTLVAQVDSAYGGKTGVNLEGVKNYVGAYHLPAAVIADTETLETLPQAELAAGFVEVLKTGLLAGGALWDQVRDLDELDPKKLDRIIFDCARYKCEVVAEDERDAGLRHVLNLGHTVGHAIEGSGHGDYNHGEAVGLGLLAALRLSDTPQLRDQVEDILIRRGLPVRWRGDFEVVMAHLQMDKKRTAAGVGFVLLSEPGQPRTGQLIDQAKVRAAVEELIE